MAREAFSMIPVSIDEAIQREELSPHRGEVLKRLIYRCGASGETEFTLPELREFLRGYKPKVEALRRDLEALEKAGWIVCERSRGHGSNVWKLRLTNAARGIREELNSSQADTTAPGNPHGNTDAAPNLFLAPASVSAAQITDADQFKPQACGESETDSLAALHAAERLVGVIRPE